MPSFFCTVDRDDGRAFVVERALFAQIEQERARTTAVSEVVLSVNSRNQLTEVLNRAITSPVERH